LGHAGASNDVAAWVSKLDGLTASGSEVLTQLAASSEHQALLTGAFGIALGGEKLSSEQG
jgi:hypothetical protein